MNSFIATWHAWSGCVIACLTIHLLKAVWVVSSLRLQVFLWTRVSISLGNCPRLPLPNYMVRSCWVFKENRQTVFQGGRVAVIHQQRVSNRLSAFSPTFGVITNFYFNHRWACRDIAWFSFAFPHQLMMFNMFSCAFFFFLICEINCWSQATNLEGRYHGRAPRPRWYPEIESVLEMWFLEEPVVQIWGDLS